MSIFGVTNAKHHSVEPTSFDHFDPFMKSGLTPCLLKNEHLFKNGFVIPVRIDLESPFLEFLMQKIIVLKQFLVILIDYGLQNSKSNIFFQKAVYYNNSIFTYTVML